MSVSLEQKEARKVSADRELPAGAAAVTHKIQEKPKRSLRIAMAGIRGLPPRYGGSETCVDELGRFLHSWDHAVTVYSRIYKGDHAARPDSYHNMKLVYFHSLKQKNLDTPFHSLLVSLHLLFKGTQDVVHFHGVGNSLFLPFFRLSPVATVVTVDGRDWDRGKWGFLARKILKLSAKMAVRFADGIITDTPEAQKLYREEFNRETTYIPYGAHTETIETQVALEKWGLKPGRYILFVGRFIPEKGIQYLVDAYNGLETDFPLVLVGGNEYDLAFVQKLKNFARPGIIFPGFVFGRPFEELLQHCALYVQPSDVEGTSPVLLNAMALGRCVIVSGIKENLDVVEKTALSFSPGSSGHLAEIMKQALNDEGLRKDLGRMAQDRVRVVYSWETVSKSHLEAYYAALEVKRGGARPDVAT
ncbi:MAG: glycosyltransferase family 4 protein [Candidatus Eisenbacteria bacterium]|uniref:Glycosyltransferase family 4 protein n=1 Tax=Eiseniibacteriota bacterium TaxID=2212470 RepID=A0A948RZ44_UNCEI|nr:glycosyltransferase family 4 protein [Candidatus Eisenbacteria bacterium]MBU1948838.1 glycosyltransferase family 4 protein [Candidatus Eisenbacteria bacterium]MBU2692293.1 glycosyltransferase family 4 protein [Candidatus Eisenbacteria bacterium]